MDTSPREGTNGSPPAGDDARHMVIAGASGVVGRHLIRAARPSWRVTILTRRIDGSEPESVTPVAWNPSAARVGDEEHLKELGRLMDDADAVVNLAGASIDEGRFDEDHRQRVMQSRLDATNTLVEAVHRAATAPEAWFQASAVGIYGDRGEEELDASSEPANDFFLAEVCKAWEGAAAAAGRRCRVVVGRQGMVLAPEAAAWRKLTLPIRLGVGGPLGSGRQWWSWIHAEDHAAAVLHLLDPPADDAARRPEGVYALTAPEPARQIEVTRAAARVLHRPAWMPVPASALRIAVGGLADMLLLPSTRMRPTRLLGEGFAFEYREIDEAARALLRS